MNKAAWPTLAGSTLTRLVVHTKIEHFLTWATRPTPLCCWPYCGLEHACSDYKQCKCVRVSVSVRACVRAHGYMHACLRACLHACVRVCACARSCVYVRVCDCAFARPFGLLLSCMCVSAFICLLRGILPFSWRKGGLGFNSRFNMRFCSFALTPVRNVFIYGVNFKVHIY